jgi:hypothetical protein
MGFLDKAKAAAQQATEKAKEGVSDVQTKREIGQTYDELGKKAFELAESGAITHPELTELVDKIKDLKTKLEEDDSSGNGDGASGDGGTTTSTTAEPPASSAPPAMPT